VLTRDPI